MSFDSSDLKIEPSADDTGVAKAQLLVSSLTLTLFAAFFAIAQFAFSYDDRLAARDIARWKTRPNATYFDARFFNNYNERLLYEILPSADYSQGGVYFSGTSVTGGSLVLPTWSAADQKLVHDYCILVSNHSEQAKFFQYLVAHEDLLKAGSRKTVIISELFFGAAIQNAERDREWRAYFTSRGLFSIDDADGIHAVPESRLLRSWRMPQVKSDVFWHWATNVHLMEAVGPGKRQDTQSKRDYWSRVMGPRWQASMDTQIAALGQQMDNLRASNVTVVAVYMPQASWADGFDRAEQYRHRVLSMLKSKSIEVTDLSHAADDDDFADSVHLNYAGAMKIQPALIALAEKYRHRIEAP